jgi:hypothetical protein
MLFFLPATAYATHDFNIFIYNNFKGKMTIHYDSYGQKYNKTIKFNFSKYMDWLNYTPTFFNIYLNSFNMVWYPEFGIIFKVGFDETKIGVSYYF